MGSDGVQGFIDEVWERDVMPTLLDYIRIPNVSQVFEANWEELGHMERAVTLLADWAKARPVEGMQFEIHRLEGRSPVLFAEIPPAGTCAGKPCWKSIKGGFKRRDKTLAAAGNSVTLLKEGTATRTKILVQGKGDNIPMPTLPLTPTVTVQLKNSAGVCWETVHGTFKKNTSDQYKSNAN